MGEARRCDHTRKYCCITPRLGRKRGEEAGRERVMKDRGEREDRGTKEERQTGTRDRKSTRDQKPESPAQNKKKKKNRAFLRLQTNIERLRMDSWGKGPPKPAISYLAWELQTSRTTGRQGPA